MASTKTETMLVWVGLPPGCKLSAHLEHVGGFAAHLHHVAKIVGGFRVDHQHIGTTNAPIINLCLKHLPFQRYLEVLDVRRLRSETNII